MSSSLFSPADPLPVPDLRNLTPEERRQILDQLRAEYAAARDRAQSALHLYESLARPPEFVSPN